MTTLRIKDVFKRYPNGAEAVKGVSVDVEDGELVVFVGPSGCGKSTLLRMVAGLESITSGDIELAGRVGVVAEVVAVTVTRVSVDVISAGTAIPAR